MKYFFFFFPSFNCLLGLHDRPNEVIQRGRQGNFGERGATSLSMLALLNPELEFLSSDLAVDAVPDV